MSDNILDLIITTKECAVLYDMHHLTVNSRIRTYGEEGKDFRVSQNNKHDLIILKSFADKVLKPSESIEVGNTVKVKPGQRVDVEGRDFTI